VLIACSPAQLQFITFAFMAGEYAPYLTAQPGAAAAGCDASEFKSGPHALWQWVVAWEPCHTFQPAFLILWGAKCVALRLTLPALGPS